MKRLVYIKEALCISTIVSLFLKTLVKVTMLCTATLTSVSVVAGTAEGLESGIIQT